MALGPTQPPIQWVPGALSLGVKRLGREADYSSSSSPEVKNARSYTSTPAIRLHGVVLSSATNSIEQSPYWEAIHHSSSKEISVMLRNPKIYYRVHKNAPVVPILSQMNPVHILPPYFPKIDSHIIFHSTPRTSKWSLHFRCLTKILLAFLISSMRATFSTHLIHLDLITLIIFGGPYKLWCSSLCSHVFPWNPVECYLHSLSLGVPFALFPLFLQSKLGMWIYVFSRSCYTCQ
jgi:hypothetical protein